MHALHFRASKEDSVDQGKFIRGDGSHICHLDTNPFRGHRSDHMLESSQLEMCKSRIPIKSF